MLVAGKERLDVLLVSRGLFTSREQARRSIMAGAVYVDGVRELKPGTAVPENASTEVRGETLPFVSRGGLKLAKALQHFGISVTNRDCLDVGASTGGFTDCLLQNGARHVHAVDVGYGQLAWQLRQDPRVTVLERTNIRHLEPGQVPMVDMVTIDVSFISLTKVLPIVRTLLRAGGDVVALVKPQFEAGREQVGKKGVVRDAATHQRVLTTVIAAAAELGFHAAGVTYSPIKGPEGNIEFLLHLVPADASAADSQSVDVANVVTQAHNELP